MRTEGSQPGIAGSDDFLPAIRPEFVDRDMADSVRFPKWHVLRFNAQQPKPLIRALHFIGMPFHNFTFERRQPRRRPTTCAWLPGFIFLEFDPITDRWQQINRMPSVIGFLGKPTPLPDGTIDDLKARLPERLARNTPKSVIAVGTQVKIRDGALVDQVGTVTRSDHKNVWIITIVFNAPVETRVSAANVEVIGNGGKGHSA